MEKLEQLKKELEEVRESKFYLEMKDRWTNEDFKTNDKFNEKIKELEKEIEKEEGLNK